MALKLKDLKIGQKVYFNFGSFQETPNTIIIGFSTVTSHNIIISESQENGIIVPNSATDQDKQDFLKRDNIDVKYHKYKDTMKYIKCEYISKVEDLENIQESYTQGYLDGCTGLRWL